MSSVEEHVPSTPTKRKSTPGEELYLIHLTRQKQHPYPEGICHLQDPEEEEEEDDHDYEVPRKRSRSVGEELWEVYLKRSEGLEPDYDTPPHGGDDDTTDGKGSNETKTDGHQREEHVMNLRGDKNVIMSDHPTSGVLHLRNRDVPLH